MMIHQKKNLSAAVLYVCLLACSNAMAQDSTADGVNLQRATNNLSVPIFKSRVVQLDAPAARVSVGNPDVADILILRATQLYVLGKSLGTTNVLLWDRQDRLIGTVSVEVAHDVESLKYKLHQLLPGEPIEIYSAQKRLVLKGQISSVPKMDAALAIAEGYLAEVKSDNKAAGGVINMLQVGGGQQVMLEVKVAEINRTELKRLDANFNVLNVRSNQWSWGGVNGGASFPDANFPSFNFIDPETGIVLTQPGGRVPTLTDGLSGPGPWGMAVREFNPDTHVIEDQGLFASFLSNSTMFNIALDAARDQGLAKILAEPTLTTLSGEEAKFLSGGEFPIPVPRGDNGITIQFKEFGVGLTFLPLVLGDGVINVKLNVVVSELVNANTVGIGDTATTAEFIIPALSKRSARATVELREGQTMGIAGLINENVREGVTKFPGLGEIPILGALFRSQEFLTNETELVILVTPKLAKPLRQQDIRLPTDDFVPPTDWEFYMLGRLEGTKDASNDAGTDGNYGHTVEE